MLEVKEILIFLKRKKILYFWYNYPIIKFKSLKILEMTQSLIKAIT